MIRNVILCMVILSLSLTGCGKKDSVSIIEDSENMPKGKVGYPLKTDIELTCWTPLNANVSQVASTMNDTEFAKVEYEKTGIKIKYIHPTLGQERDHLNLLLAAGDLPDIIQTNWYDFPGGPEKAILDGYIIKLNDLMEDYAPNFAQTMRQLPDINKMVKSDSGSYYAFPGIRKASVAYGPLIRADWLRDIGMEVPETIDEWHAMLTAFKQKKGAKAPLSYVGRVPLRDAGAFSGAFGVRQNFYIEDEKVKYGPYEPGYKEFIETFSKWFSEGLIDKNLPSIDKKGLDAKMLNGETGATLGYNSSDLGRWLQSKKDDKFDMTGAKYPVLHKGEKVKFAKMDWAYAPTMAAAITSQSKNKFLAARYLDYGFSQEGQITYSFGKEGVSYNMVDGKPVYTDLILKNSDGLTVSLALAKYTHGAFEGPFNSHPEAARQTMLVEQQRTARDLWSDNEASKYLPPPMLPTSEESSAIKDKMVAIESLVEEYTFWFVMGIHPLSEYDQYLSELKKLGIDDVLKVQQAAYERYKNR